MRKNLKPLVDLSRSAEGSIASKVIAPKALGVGSMYSSIGVRQGTYRPISAYTPSAVFQWLQSFWHYRVGKRPAFKTYQKTNGITTMPSMARISLVADWGSGTNEAYEIGQNVHSYNSNYTIHLGDIYYVGDSSEVNENFLGISESQYEACIWPRGFDGSFVLPGNHEFYSRGISFYDQVLPSVNQEASYFCLENDYWRIIGLDTGYNSIGIPLLENVIQPSCGLRQEQIDWINDVVQPEKDKRGIILLSHHQYYSAFEKAYPKAGEQLSSIIKRPVLWFWGHEHRMTVYNKYKNVYGRCIGHGGMPVEIIDTINDLKYAFTDTRLYPNDEGLSIGYNGYVNLVFNGNTLQVNYMDVHGSQVYKENVFVGNGVLSVN